MALHYRIGEFADLSGVTRKTLRFYDHIGLFRPTRVDPLTRYRYYGAEQLEELAAILAFKDLGVSLAAVRNLTRKGGSNERRRELLMEVKRKLETSVKTAEQSLSWISAALEELADAKPAIPVVVKRRPAVPIASIRARVRDYAEMDRLESELQNSLPPQSLGDLRGTLWHHCADSGYLEGEVFIGLKRRVPPRSLYGLKQLPAATLACAYSGPEVDSAEQAYIAIRKWMELRAYGLAGPKREIYLPQMLEIQFPLKPL
jgi:DNA-binding transcriptional MerR regulator